MTDRLEAEQRFRERLRAKYPDGKGPTKLFRYVAIQDQERKEWVRQTLLDSTLFMSSFSALNDPYEGRVLPHFKAEPAKVDAYWRAFMAENPHEKRSDPETRISELVTQSSTHEGRKQLSDRLAGIIESYGVLCLSEKGTSLPMWSYYSAAHRGLCLQFRFGVEFVEWSAGLGLLTHVEYQEDFPQVPFYGDQVDLKMRTALATKAKDWQHEAEWRLVSATHRGRVRFPPVLLEAVILGARVSETDEAWVRELLAQRVVLTRLLRARVVPEAFALALEPA